MKVLGKLPVMVAAAFILAIIAPAWSGSATPPPADDTSKSQRTGSNLPIRSRAALDAYLQTHATPIDLMSRGGRQRFLDSLRFNDGNLTGISVADLSSELTTDEIREVLELLGLERYAVDGITREEADAFRSRRPSEDESNDFSDIERRFNALYYQHEKSDLSQVQRGTSLIVLFERLFPAAKWGSNVRSASDHDLRLLFRASEFQSFYQHSPDNARTMRIAFDELARRNLLTADDRRTMHRTLIQAGLLDESRELAQHHPGAGLQPLPQTRELAELADGTPSAWQIEAGRKGLVHRPVALAPLRIIVVASPGCGFSQAAAHDLAADPLLGPIFREHAQWLSPPEDLAYLDSLERWNRAHPEATLMVAASESRWPMIQWGATPQFYFFRDGELVEATSGWTPDHRGALLNTLRRIGLVTKAER